MPADVMVAVMFLEGEDDIEHIRFVTADEGGKWLADFSTPGDKPGEETTYNIKKSSLGAAGQYEADEDMTAVFWSAAKDKDKDKDK